MRASWLRVGVAVALNVLVVAVLTDRNKLTGAEVVVTARLTDDARSQAQAGSALLAPGQEVSSSSPVECVGSAEHAVARVAASDEAGLLAATVPPTVEFGTEGRSGDCAGFGG